MKKKFSSILGAGLALVLAFTMAGGAFLAAPAPEAEAGTLSWSTFGIPSSAGNVLVEDGEDLGPVAPSPNFSTDDTVFAAVNLTGSQTVYKSTDGGHTWTGPTEIDSTSDQDIVALAVSPQYATDSTVVAATKDYVYRSTDGGATFAKLGGKIPGASEEITCLDISPNYDGVGVIAVGLVHTDPDTTPAVGTEVKLWGADGALNWTDFGMPIDKQVDVTAIKFSPNYAIDSALLAVGSGNTTGIIPYPGTKLYTRSSDQDWDFLIGGPTTIASLVGDSGNTTSGILYSSIALPSDYNGTKSTLRRAYVSITSKLGPVDDADDVYRVTNITDGVDTGLNRQLVNIDYSGDFADGTIVGGLYATSSTEAEVYNTTNPTASVVDWYATNNPPSGKADGVTCYVAMDKDYETSKIVFAGTIGNASAFAVSYDGADNWTETGLIDNAGANLEVLGAIALSPNYATDETVYLLAKNSSGTYDTSLWRTENDGTYWDRVHFRDYADAGTGVIAISGEYASDNTVYIGDSGEVNLSYSDDKGESWSNRTIASGRNVEINSMVAPDATTLYVGDDDSGSIAKSTNSGYVWSSGDTVPTGGGARIASIAVEDSVVLVGDGEGSVFRSTDAGASWSQVATTVSGGGNMYVAFSGDTIYALSQDLGDVYRFVIGDADWTEIDTTTNTGLGLALAPDGTLYAASSTESLQVHRSINPTENEPVPGVDWEYVDATGLTATAISGLSVTPVNTLAVIQGTAVKVFTDTLAAGTAGPTLVSPADGSTLASGNSVRFQFEAVTNALEYDVWYSTDSTFATTDGAADAVTAPATQTGWEDITPDSLSYWKVRVKAGEPLLSPWSEVWTVTPQVTTPIVAPSPRSPAPVTESHLNVPVEPMFNWTAFKYATGYELLLASDTTFSAESLIADLTGDAALGNVTSWKCTTTLDNDTDYYWKVRAITATATSDWSEIVGFTTEAAEVVPIVEEPTTPAYVWAIIGVGFVLVIAVIVLITRTRRVV